MSVVGDILAEPQAVILYDREEESAVREVMHDLVDTMAASLSVADPLLANLTVIDLDSRIAEWPEWFHITPLSEVDETHFHRSQNIVSLAPSFLRRRLTVPLASATRFYAMTPDEALADRFPITTLELATEAA